MELLWSELWIGKSEALLAAVLSVSIINHLRLLTPHLAFIRQTKCSIMKTWHEDTFL